MRGVWAWLGITSVLAYSGCGAAPIEHEGQFGAAIPLSTGDDSPLPRLAFIDEQCPGASAVGGCPTSGGRTCEPLLIDSLATLTAVRDAALAPGVSSFAQECLEIREAAGLSAPSPAAEDLDAAVARFRFDALPVIRAAEEGSDDWTWTAGDETHVLEPGGVLGGNLLRTLALSIRMPRDGEPILRVYGEFPGDEQSLADQGRAYLPLQFPGRLLGRDLEDRCRIDGSRCELEGYDLRPGQSNIALVPTRMVVDACLAAPPCTLRYHRDADDPFAAGFCALSQGQGLDLECDDASTTGRPASLVVATAVPDVVLFDDSARRMFGDLDGLPDCASTDATTLACRAAQDGALAFSGWPDAGFDVPLLRLSVRSVALVPGVVSPRDVGPCERVDRRLRGLHEQCDQWSAVARRLRDIRDTSPPFAGDPTRGFSESSLVVLGETSLQGDAPVPDPSRWITVRVLPATHPLALSIRRDVAPEAIQPDGLLGAALFDDTETILDYTDPNPGLRMRCLEPREEACTSLPDCRENGQRACCFGLPLPLVLDFITGIGDETCCGALSASELEEVQALGHCQGLNPP